jgi:putative effector of murein hydrolase
VDSLAAFLTPTVLALALAWNFAVLTSVQLTVRLIKAYSPRATLVAAALLTAMTVPITVAYHHWFRPDLSLFAVAMVLTGIGGWLIADRVLGFRRRRSVVVAALGVGLLSAPWGAFLVR